MIGNTRMTPSSNTPHQPVGCLRPRRWRSLTGEVGKRLPKRTNRQGIPEGHLIEARTLTTSQTLESTYELDPSRRLPKRDRRFRIEFALASIPFALALKATTMRSHSENRRKQRCIAGGKSAMGHVWTAPAVQEESDGLAKRSGAAMYPACCRMKDGPSSRCSHCGRWP